jgi:hypothetical protein
LRLRRFVRHRLEDKTVHQFLKFSLSSSAPPLYQRVPRGEFICPVNRQILFAIVVLALIVPSPSAAAWF